MKPFSLQEYLANPSRKVVTRYGRPVRIICTDAKGNYPVIGLVLSKEVEDPNSYTENGVYLNDSESSIDLFFAPEQKEMFDPHTLKPFDKVLVRFNQRYIWKCDLFSHIEESGNPYMFHCISGRWCECIPYNDDTKHLVGTNNDAPEYYRYWEK